MIGKLVRNCGLISLVHISKFRGRIMLLNFFTVRPNKTPTTDHRAHDAPSWVPSHQAPIFYLHPSFTGTYKRLSYPFFEGLKILCKCPPMVTYDWLSYPRWSVLHNLHGCHRLSFLESQYFSHVSLDGSLRRTVNPMMVRPALPSRFSVLILKVFHEETPWRSITLTKDLWWIRRAVL